MGLVTTVVTERFGLIAEILRIFEEYGLDMDNIFVEVVQSKAIVSMKVDDPKKVSDVLGENGFKCKFSKLSGAEANAMASS